jgi:hypothetical protein
LHLFADDSHPSFVNVPSFIRPPLDSISYVLHPSSIHTSPFVCPSSPVADQVGWGRKCWNARSIRVFVVADMNQFLLSVHSLIVVEQKGKIARVRRLVDDHGVSDHRGQAHIDDPWTQSHSHTNNILVSHPDTQNKLRREAREALTRSHGPRPSLAKVHLGSHDPNGSNTSLTRVSLSFHPPTPLTSSRPQRSLTTHRDLRQQRAVTFDGSRRTQAFHCQVLGLRLQILLLYSFPNMDPRRPSRLSTALPRFLTQVEHTQHRYS